MIERILTNLRRGQERLSHCGGLSRAGSRDPATPLHHLVATSFSLLSQHFQNHPVLRTRRPPYLSNLTKKEGWI